jgi:hypothetical protein
MLEHLVVADGVMGSHLVHGSALGYPFWMAEIVIKPIDHSKPIGASDIVVISELCDAVVMVVPQSSLYSSSHGGLINFGFNIRSCRRNGPHHPSLISI